MEATKMRLTWRRVRLGILAAALSAGTLGCVDAYDGSWVEFSLGGGTQLPSNEGNIGNGQPPANTHYEFWVETGPSAFKVAEFLVVKQFDSSFPCFIETGRTDYPGLHSTQYYNKLLEEALKTGDPTTPDQDEVNRLADADKRMRNMALVEAGLKAVVGYDPKVTPEVLDALKSDVSMHAPITDTSPEANANRLKICNAFFAAHPDYYVGGDKVFSLPLAGHWYGMVESTDPRSNAPVGGSGFTVPFTFKKFDYFWMTWQFNQVTYKPNGELDESQPFDPLIKTSIPVPGDTMNRKLGPFGPSATGYHYMSGAPREATRRTINVDLQNQQFRGINGKMAIFPAINEDDAIF
jgi:hypothetical protein